MTERQLRAGTHSERVRSLARDAGFDHCGIATATFLEAEAPRLERWLKQGMHGTMAYMEQHFDKRLDPRQLVPGARSVISLLVNYHSRETQPPDVPRISTYAYSRKDYHRVIKDMLFNLVQRMQEELGHFDGRVFVDSAPVLDKAWAARSGLGWIGKNSNLIRKGEGSFFFIAEIICDLELEPDHPATDHCGSCTRCIDACPTQAIVAPFVVDGSRCISHYTIELKEAIPASMQGAWSDWMFGCDVCQDVCPWNRFSTPHRNPGLEPVPEVMQWSADDWYEMTEDVFNRVFGTSALKRRKYEGIRQNLKFLQSPGD